jgi:hypothetical protein
MSGSKDSSPEDQTTDRVGSQAADSVWAKRSARKVLFLSVKLPTT